MTDDRGSGQISEMEQSTEIALRRMKYPTPRLLERIKSLMREFSYLRIYS